MMIHWRVLPLDQPWWVNNHYLYLSSEVTTNWFLTGICNGDCSDGEKTTDYWVLPGKDWKLGWASRWQISILTYHSQHASSCKSPVESVHGNLTWPRSLKHNYSNFTNALVINPCMVHAADLCTGMSFIHDSCGSQPIKSTFVLWESACYWHALGTEELVFGNNTISTAFGVFVLVQQTPSVTEWLNIKIQRST